MPRRSLGEGGSVLNSPQADHVTPDPRAPKVLEPRGPQVFYACPVSACQRLKARPRPWLRYGSFQLSVFRCQVSVLPLQLPVHADPGGARSPANRCAVDSVRLGRSNQELNLSAARGSRCPRSALSKGRCDYLLLVDRKPVGVIEAKKEGITLSAVAEQSGHYAENLPDFLRIDLVGTLPFSYESTGVETFFRDERDPDPRSRRVFAFHRPETLAEWLEEPDTLRPPRPDALRRSATTAMTSASATIEAIRGLEKSFAAAQPRALIQMATGAGKTYTACAFTYRLIKYGGARRVLFLVDRANLGRQAIAEFQQFVAPDTGRKFTELYNVQHLTSNQLDPVARVTICTIQRVYSMLRGEELRRRRRRDLRLRDRRRRRPPARRRLQPRLPIETFDFIITDECHRSIYNLWRQVLEYFDAFLIGLTATPRSRPSASSTRTSSWNTATSAPSPMASMSATTSIASAPQVTEQGGKVDAGLYVDQRSKRPAPSAGSGSTKTSPTTRKSSTAPSSCSPDPHRPAGLSRRSARAVPRPVVSAEDAHLRQGRLPRRGHRPHLPRSLRQGQRLLQEDHLQDLATRTQALREVRAPHPGVPHLAAAPHRRHRRHDRHRHRHQAAGVPRLPARRAQPRLLRADEGPRHPCPVAHRPAGRQRRRRPRQDPLRHRRCRRRLRERQDRLASAGAQADRYLESLLLGSSSRETRRGHAHDAGRPARPPGLRSITGTNPRQSPAATAASR